jgi:riboflavin kinase/FMN adenylyltransferase
MKKISAQIQKELSQVRPQKETLLTVGVFDGIHLGHQHLLSHLKVQAKDRNCLSGVVTFKTHPESVLSSGTLVPWLTGLEDRIALIHELGIDLVIVLSFTLELSRLSAREFVQLLKDRLKMSGLLIGPDFALGKDREGDIENLRSLGKEIGFTVEVFPPVTLDGMVVSSSIIRQFLVQGDIRKVEKLTGRRFSITAKVVSGARRGRTLGFPTANLKTSPDQALPADGVYATIAYIDHKPMPAITNIGIRPTFGGGARIIETHLFDYTGDLLGQRLKIEFLHRIREERHFTTVEDLKTQIARDIEQAKAMLANTEK